MALGFLVMFVCPLLTAAAVAATTALGPRDLAFAVLPGQVWTNDPSLLLNFTLEGFDSAVGAIQNPSFGAGFYCASSPCESFLLAVFFIVSHIDDAVPSGARVVWTPNRDRPVHANATLSFGSDGGLVLSDVDGSLFWSADTSGKPAVRGLTLTYSGNLVLLDLNDEPVWQSFDHPADCLVPGQPLIQGMKLTPAASPNNKRSADEQLYLTVLSDGLYAFVGTSPPQLYYQNINPSDNETKSIPTPYAVFWNGSLDIFLYDHGQAGIPDIMIPLESSPAYGQSLQSMRFEADGHLRLYDWMQDGVAGPGMAQDVLQIDEGDCGYPTVCGDYGLCLGSQCTCPFEANTSIVYFRQIDSRRINLGCEPVTAISCQSIRDHKLLAFPNVSYFNDLDKGAVHHRYTDEESCKQACLMNCSCKAAVFKYYANTSDGSCFLPSALFALKVVVPEKVNYYSSAYIKVQMTQPPPGLPTDVAAPAYSRAAWIVPIILVSAGGLIALILSIIILIRRKRKRYQEIDEEGELGELPGMPTRFSLEQLKIATEQFREKLGEGGFGSVYAGQLPEERIAVKRLDQAGQGKKEFLAEVHTIGSIHHINLVRLVGFCADKSHRLLVYEYMSKGSLDKWIYYQHGNAPLGWNTRCSVITDIAKGLCYLHEECRQKIAHLDVKPQNILLDENFNAKLSDFGLAKLIDRDKSQVITRLRGTPGYLAPEWLTSQITEKADIYSFGVVVMEVIGGRKNIDNSQPEESIHLISLLQEKVKNDQLVDLIDENSDDMQVHKEEAIKMMKLAMWCLQIDCNKRPPMSIVVKVLEGILDVETDIDYSFVATTTPVNLGAPANLGLSAPPLASHLSGPR